jgi:hypothetical protein
MYRPKRNRIAILVSIIFSVSLIAGSILIVLFRQRILDQIIVWQFKPSSSIAQIASRDSMSDYGKFLFYASQPELDAAQYFNSVCNRIENTTSILGCYSNSRLYIYNVTDVQLDGIREVTAAHEMLHAAYARLSNDEKSKINVLLEVEYKKVENNKEFAELIAFYARTEPGERDNELHSVIGTEITNIAPELESYYGQYFSNRQDVVKLYVKYNGVFQDLANQASTLSNQLTVLAKTIMDDSSQYNIDVKTLTKDIASFNKRASIGDFTSQSQFNTERATLSVRLAKLNAKSVSINKNIDKYNAMLNEYNAIATQSKKLYNSIDSTLAPAPSV